MKECRRVLCIVGLLAISACIKQPSLEEKLAAAPTPQEREKTAYYECIKNANYPVPGGHSNAYVGHESRQWELCEQMHKLNKGEK